MVDAKTPALEVGAVPPSNDSSIRPRAHMDSRLRGNDGIELARVVLDDQVRFHLDWIGHVLELGSAHEAGLHVVVIDLEILGRIAFGRFDALQDQVELPALGLDLNLVESLSQAFGES